MKTNISFKRAILMYLLLQAAVILSLALVICRAAESPFNLFVLLGAFIVAAAISVFTARKVIHIASAGIDDCLENINQFSLELWQIAMTLSEFAKSLEGKTLAFHEHAAKQAELAAMLGSLYLGLSSNELANAHSEPTE